MTDYVMRNEEKIIFSLRSLYEKYGYMPYKMTKFEEYDLYGKNKDFLISDNVITFTDTNGKLMALKPDVTLSIVKNNKHATDSLRKVYYNENVYRVSKGTHSFKEILQIGIECLGNVDSYCLSETISLAVKSLKKISDKSILTVSDVDILSDVLDSTDASSDAKKQILSLIGEKNLHELNAICAENEISSETVDILCQLATLHGSTDTVIAKLKTLLPDNKKVLRFEKLIASLSAETKKSIEIDFSIVGDTKYYNGITFKGFIDSIPNSVLSGGQYDRLMEKMHQKSQAVGFAIYLDELERLNEDYNEYDVDTVLLYDDSVDLSALNTAVEKLAESTSVIALREVPEKLRYRQLMKFDGKEAKSI